MTFDSSDGNHPSNRPVGPDTTLRDLVADILARDGLVGMVDSALLVYTWNDEDGTNRRSASLIGSDVALLGLAWWAVGKAEALVEEGDDEYEDDEG